jgi:hypothetical protein
MAASLLGIVRARVYVIHEMHSRETAREHEIHRALGTTPHAACAQAIWWTAWWPPDAQPGRTNTDLDKDESVALSAGIKTDEVDRVLEYVPRRSREG